MTTKMYRTNPDFVFTVTRDFVRNCQTPVLILPDDIPAHPCAVAVEAAMLAPKAEVSMFPWKEPKERIPLAVRQNTFLPPGTSPCFCLAGGVIRSIDAPNRQRDSAWLHVTWGILPAS